MIVSDLQPDVPPLQKGMKVKIGYSEQFSRDFEIDLWSGSKLKAKLHLKYVESKESAAELKEMGIFAKKEDLKKIDKDYIPIEEIIGCRTFDVNDGTEIGEILEVWETPANKVWLVMHAGREITIPVVEQVVKSVDTGNKRIEIEVIEGLLDI